MIAQRARRAGRWHPWRPPQRRSWRWPGPPPSNAAANYGCSHPAGP